MEDWKELRASFAPPCYWIPDPSNVPQTLGLASGSTGSVCTNRGGWKLLKVRSLGSRPPHPQCLCKSAAGEGCPGASSSGQPVVPSGPQTGTPGTSALPECPRHRGGQFLQNNLPGLWWCQLVPKEDMNVGQEMLPFSRKGWGFGERPWRESAPLGPVILIKSVNSSRRGCYFEDHFINLKERFVGKCYIVNQETP